MVKFSSDFKKYFYLILRHFDNTLIWYIKGQFIIPKTIFENVSFIINQ